MSHAQTCNEERRDASSRQGSRVDDLVASSRHISFRVDGVIKEEKIFWESPREVISDGMDENSFIKPSFRA